MTTLPEDLQRLADAMNAADTAAEELSTSLSDEDFFWRPDGGTRWSVALCLDHLAVANDLYGRAIESGIAAARERGLQRQGPLTPGFLGRKFAESLAPPVKRRTSAPGKITPQATRSRAEIMAPRIARRTTGFASCLSRRLLSTPTARHSRIHSSGSSA
ncbi:MAG: DinB family protein [Acidobacteriota bacterium]|nr:DinB family protein [Acidobacteriota bacterium]